MKIHFPLNLDYIYHHLLLVLLSKGGDDNYFQEVILQGVEKTVWREGVAHRN